VTTLATRAGQNLARTISIICVFALVVAVVLWWIAQGANTRKITAYFDQTVGVYPGSTVRVLGVQVGTIDDVTPVGTQVKVDMSVDRSVQIPANAQAVVVAPSVVSDRYIQLAPVYAGGATMGDAATIPRSRTATPVELDQLYNSLNKLSTSLGPNGANQNGALSNLLNTAAANLNGNGQNLHDTITQLSDLSQTLDSNKANLFATVDNLAQFTTMLANSDATVRKVSQQLSDVTGFLAGERGNLGAAVQQLATALGQIQGFINNNRNAIKSNVDNLTQVTQVLVQERSALAETLDDAPLALTNLVDSYNAASGSLDARADLNDLSNPPAVEVCHLLQQLAPGNIPAAIKAACDVIAPVLQGLVALPTPANIIEDLQSGKIPPLPLPIAGVLYASPSTTGSTSGGGK
jgi:phospholipid/cholesterol/gamma-HCH transport system substrate-binding protein